MVLSLLRVAELLEEGLSGAFHARAPSCVEQWREHPANKVAAHVDARRNETLTRQPCPIRRYFQLACISVSLVRGALRAVPAVPLMHDRIEDRGEHLVAL